MDLTKFWFAFDMQHATFSRKGLKAQFNKLSWGHSPQMGPKAVPTTSPGYSSAARTVSPRAGSGVKGGLAGTAAVAYSISRAANRYAVESRLKYDIAKVHGDRIKRMCPDKGKGGVLVAYTVWMPNVPDHMGTYPVTYEGPPGVLGAGRTTVDVYMRFMGPRQMSIGPATSRPKNKYKSGQTSTICYAWLFREEHTMAPHGGVLRGPTAMS